MKEKIKQETIENAQKEIAKSELWIEFYEDYISKIKVEKDKAVHLAKVEGIKKAVEFNQAVINFFS